MKFFLLLLLSILCLKSFSQTVVTGKVGTETGDKLEIEFFEYLKYVKETISVNAHGQFKKEFFSNRPMYIRVKASDMKYSPAFLLVLPNETLQINLSKSNLNIGGSLAPYNLLIVQLFQDLKNFANGTDPNIITQYILEKTDAFFTDYNHPKAAEIKDFNDAFWISGRKLYPFLRQNNSDLAKMNALEALWQGDSSQINTEDKLLYKYLNKIDFNNPILPQSGDILNMVNNAVRIRRMNQVEQDSTLNKVDAHEIETKIINQIFAGTLIKTPLLGFNLLHRIEAYREYPMQLSGVEEYITAFANEQGADLYLQTIKKIYREQTLTKGVIAPGAKAPEFKLHDVSGKMVSLSDFRNKVVYIDFWATWCAPCLKEMPYLNALKEKYKGKDVAILSISIDTDTEKWRKKIVDLKLDGVQLIDSIGSHDSKIAKDYKLYGVPNFVLIDKKGRIHLPAAPAPSDTAQIEASINELLNK